MNKAEEKAVFFEALRALLDDMGKDIKTEDGQWSIKGFIDVFRSIYTISADTKVVSKILELHLFPRLLKFASEAGYAIVLADHQNYYPDISFVSKTTPDVKFAVDFKTTYRDEKNSAFCNGFTLGSHGEYFKNRSSTKNIQFPYKDYAGHFCLGIIYSRNPLPPTEETRVYRLEELKSITSVIRDFQFFVQEKWKIASDRSGSGNTANIGSIDRIEDIVSGHGMFSVLGEDWFDDYWMNYKGITVRDASGETRVLRNLTEFVSFRGGDTSKVVPRARRAGSRG